MIINVKGNIASSYNSLRKKAILFTIILLICSSTFAQTNLVPNYSFENYTVCPREFNAPPPKTMVYSNKYWYLLS